MYFVCSLTEGENYIETNNKNTHNYKRKSSFKHMQQPVFQKTNRKLYIYEFRPLSTLQLKNF